MGLPSHLIDACRQHLERARTTALFAVWPEHEHALQVFLGMASQWRVVAGIAGLLYLGLDYAALPLVIEEQREAVAVPQPLSRLLPQLRILERAAAEILNAG